MHGLATRALGIGTIVLVTMINDELVTTLVDEILYVPDAAWNLFSPGQAWRQGFAIEYRDRPSSSFLVTKSPKL